MVLGFLVRPARFGLDSAPQTIGTRHLFAGFVPRQIRPRLPAPGRRDRAPAQSGAAGLPSAGPSRTPLALRLAASGNQTVLSAPLEGSDGCDQGRQVLAGAVALCGPIGRTRGRWDDATIAVTRCGRVALQAVKVRHDPLKIHARAVIAVAIVDFVGAKRGPLLKRPAGGGGLQSANAVLPGVGAMASKAHSQRFMKTSRQCWTRSAG